MPEENQQLPGGPLSQPAESDDWLASLEGILSADVIRHIRTLLLDSSRREDKQLRIAQALERMREAVPAAVTLLMESASAAEQNLAMLLKSIRANRKDVRFDLSIFPPVQRPPKGKPEPLPKTAASKTPKPGALESGTLTKDDAPDGTHEHRPQVQEVESLPHDPTVEQIKAWYMEGLNDVLTACVEQTVDEKENTTYLETLEAAGALPWLFAKKGSDDSPLHFYAMNGQWISHATLPQHFCCFTPDETKVFERNQRTTNCLMIQEPRVSKILAINARKLTKTWAGLSMFLRMNESAYRQNSGDVGLDEHSPSLRKSYWDLIKAADKVSKGRLLQEIRAVCDEYHLHTQEQLQALIADDLQRPTWDDIVQRFHRALNIGAPQSLEECRERIDMYITALAGIVQGNLGAEDTVTQGNFAMMHTTSMSTLFTATEQMKARVFEQQGLTEELMST